MNDKSLRDLLRDKKASPENMTREQKAQFEKFKQQVDQYKGKDVSEIMREIDRLKLNKDVLSQLKGKELDTFADSSPCPLLPAERRGSMMAELRPAAPVGNRLSTKESPRQYST
jgi:hypothetical protein